MPTFIRYTMPILRIGFFNTLNWKNKFIIMNIHYIYRLVTRTQPLVSFYVGRTNNMERRLREHNYDKVKGTETKYEYIRELEKHNIEWTMEKLKEHTDPFDLEYEDFFVYLEMQKGYDLTNMKKGDAKRGVYNTLNKNGFTPKDPKDLTIAVKKEKARQKSLLKKKKKVKPSFYKEAVHIDDLDAHISKESPGIRALRERNSTGPPFFDWPEYNK